MPYTEFSKDQSGNRVPMAIQTALSQPVPYQIKVDLEKTDDRLQLLIKPRGGCCGLVQKVALGLFSLLLWIVFTVSITLAETKGPLWYLGAGLVICVTVVFPFGRFKDVTTTWAIVVEGGQIKVQKRMGLCKSVVRGTERVWPCSIVEHVEVRRRRTHQNTRNKQTVKPSCLVLSLPTAENILNRSVALFENHKLDDDLLDWMAREVAQRAEVAVIVPSYGSCVGL